MSVALLIDGNSIINRSFYALPLLSNKSGVYTNAVTGFFSVLLKHGNALNPDYIAVAFDRREPTFRHEKYAGYKAARKGMPDELAGQMPYIKQILEFMGIRSVEAVGYEADDIIGTLSRLFEARDCPCHIATGDRDAFQLITERVSVRLATNKDEVVYTPEKIREIYGVEPVQMIEVKALMGDSSDSIPGVAGIGEKTALDLIRRFGNIGYIYENLYKLDISASVKNKLEKDKEICFLSRELGAIALDAPVSPNAGDYKKGAADEVSLARLLSELEMASLMKRMNISAVPAVATEETHSQTDDGLSEVLRDMEKTGVKIDVDGLTRFGTELKAGIAESEAKIYAVVGEEFNISSPKQVGEILFERLGLPGGKKTKTGYSTDADVLESLAGRHPIVPLITEYRELSKLYSTYVAGFLNKVGEDGRIHTTFRNETRTGRLSSSEPNIQNIPVRTERGRVMRRFFTAESGKVLVDADYSQIELRVLARVSEDAAMSADFANNRDIHTATAAGVFGVPEDGVTREMRNAAKAVNFGIIYGMGAFSLSKDIGVSVADAKRYIERYLERYGGVRDYLEKTVSEAKKTGYVRTLTGRIRHIPEIMSPNKNIAAAGERIAKNTPIQGTAADIIKIAMVRVFRRLEKELPDAKLILQVHDELIVEARESVSEQAAVILMEEMSAAGKEFDMDLPVDVGTGKSWYESH